MYYFGCSKLRPKDPVGHYMHNNQLRHDWDAENDLPESWRGGKIDGGFAPKEFADRDKKEAPQGQALWVQCEGWTLISFWDRSGDSRGGSSSTFISKEHLTFDQMVAVAKEEFPQLWKRFNFEVKLYEAKQ